mgnify:CR=1 FL=1
MTATADHLSNEGWKWEPTADGGTLTLRGFYMKADHATPYPHALIQGKGNVVIVLEGKNVIETTSSWYWPLLSGDGKTVNWTIREGEKGSSLEFKMPESTAKNHLPYGMAGEKVTIESGTIRAKMILSMSDSFEMTGGTVIIDGTRSGAAIETMKDDAIFTGGKLKITEGDYGISARCMDNWPPEKRKIVIDGADVEIKSGVCALIGNPILYLNGNLNISGGTRAVRMEPATKRAKAKMYLTTRTKTTDLHRLRRSTPMSRRPISGGATIRCIGRSANVERSWMRRLRCINTPKNMTNWSTGKAASAAEKRMLSRIALESGLRPENRRGRKAA